MLVDLYEYFCSVLHVLQSKLICDKCDRLQNMVRNFKVTTVRCDDGMGRPLVANLIDGLSKYMIAAFVCIEQSRRVNKVFLQLRKLHI